MDLPGSLFLDEVGVLVRPALDNVAVSKTSLRPPTKVIFDGGSLVVSDVISRGQRFAVKDVPVGEPVIQYGHPFGMSKGIAKGQLVHLGEHRWGLNAFG